MMSGIIRIRRQMVRLSAVLLLAVPVASARAQDNQWWESIPGFGKGLPSYRTSNSEERRKPEVLNDLRPDATPFRSEAMIGALQGAIARYQEIVAAGGWPLIPGNRMIRPEDDDERDAAAAQAAGHERRAVARQGQQLQFQRRSR